MRRFYRLNLTLLTPLFYWSKISSGAVFTDEFIGDLALYYAINRVKKIKDVSSSFYGKFSPSYEELKDFGFWVSCARPINVKRSEIYAHKTEFKAEVVNATPKLEKKSGKSPFKGYFKQQGIDPLSEFEAIVYCERNLLPPAIRVGTHLHTLVKVDTADVERENTISINLYSWQRIFNLNLDISKGTIEYRLPIYVTYNTQFSKEIRDEIIRLYD